MKNFKINCRRKKVESVVDFIKFMFMKIYAYSNHNTAFDEGNIIDYYEE